MLQIVEKMKRYFPIIPVIITNDANAAAVGIDNPNPKDCVPTANISGSVCYFLRDKNYTGDCLFSNVVIGEILFKNLS